MPNTINIEPNGVFTAGFQIPVRHEAQQLANDCWATCLSMIFTWKGVSISRQEILTKAVSIIPGGYQYGQQATLAETNYLAKKLTGGAVSFSRLENTSSFRFDDWAQHFNKYKPVLTSMNNHCRILMGYNGVGQIAVLDPSPRYKGPIVAGIGYLQKELRDAWVLN